MQTPGWKAQFFANIFLNWLIPFVMLLSRGAKRSEGCLLAAGGIVLVGHWIDLYQTIFPAFEHLAFVALVDVGIVVGFTSLFLQSFANGLRKSALVPQNDPYLAESLWQEPHERSRTTLMKKDITVPHTVIENAFSAMSQASRTITWRT